MRGRLFMNTSKLLTIAIVSLGSVCLYGSGNDEWMYNLDNLEREYQERIAHSPKQKIATTKASISATPIVDVDVDIVLEDQEKKSAKLGRSLPSSTLKYAGNTIPEKEIKKRKKSCSRWKRIFSCCSLDQDL